MNIKNCDRCNVRKHIYIKGSDRYVALFVSLDKMRITYSDPKYNLVRSQKGLITYLGLNVKASPNK